MSEVKRYDPTCGEHICRLEFEEVDGGDWVKATDYDRIEQECKRLRELLAAWRRMFAGGIESGELGVLRGQTDAALSAKP